MSDTAAPASQQPRWHVTGEWPEGAPATVVFVGEANRLEGVRAVILDGWVAVFRDGWDGWVTYPAHRIDGVMWHSENP